MSEENNKPKGFLLQGNLKYEIDLQPDTFTYRGQVSSENNLMNFMYLKQLTEAMINSQKNPLKKNTINKQEMQLLKSTNHLCTLYSERLAGALYDKYVQTKANPDAPKIEIVPPMANLKVEK